MDDVTSVTTPANPGIGVPTHNLYDLVGVFDINDKWQIRAGITNLTDEESVSVSARRGARIPASSTRWAARTIWA